MAKVYKFGLIPINKDDINKIDNQLNYLNKYYNDLIEIANAKELYENDIANVGLEKELILIENCENAIQLIDNQIKQTRILTQSKKDDSDLVLQKTNAQKLYKEAWKEYKTNFIKNKKIISKCEKDRIKELYASINRSIYSYYVEKYNAYWGSLNLIKNAVDDAIQSKYKNRNGRKDRLRFKKFESTGRIGIQIQNSSKKPKNRSIQNIFSGESDYASQIMVIKPANIVSFEKGKFQQGKRSQYKNYILNFCIGSHQTEKLNKNGDLITKNGIIQKNKVEPIFVEFNVILHRPLPKEGNLLGAVINKKIVGSKIEWSLDLTVDSNDIKPQIMNKKSIAYDLGWRKLSDTKYRFACWADSDNNTGEHTIDISVLLKSENLKSIIDSQFNLIKSLLSHFSNENIPEILNKKLKNILKCKSLAKLLHIYNLWVKHRFLGDEDIFIWFSHWKYRYIHLNNWFKNSIQTFLRNRKQMYLSLAKDASEKYQYVFFENLKLDNMSRGKIAGDQRFKVAPSEFKNSFSYRYEKDNIIEVEAKNTSKIHFDCGSMEELDSTVTTHICSKCKLEYDRDVNAALNILKRGIENACCERLGDAPTPITARNGEKINNIKMIDDVGAANIDSSVVRSVPQERTSRNMLDNVL